MITHNDIGYALVLKQFREDSGKKQLDIALGLGLKDQRELSDYELAKKPFKKELLQKICSFFKIKENDFKQLAKRLGNSSEGQSQIAISNANAEEYKIKSMLFQKENIELQLKNIRLEFQIHEMQCKLKSLRFNNVTKNIYVAI